MCRSHGVRLSRVDWANRAKYLDIKESVVMTSNEKAVTEVLAAYNNALNSSDTNAVMPLYMEDGVFMPPYSPSAVGAVAVRDAYDAVFAAIRLTVKFSVAEVVEMSSEWVFARTNSAGNTLNHATGKTSAEGNQELFIFRKDSDGKFKIARYSFSTTNPPAK
jgi:ketosteroid isomerase-like protein